MCSATPSSRRRPCPSPATWPTSTASSPLRPFSTSWPARNPSPTPVVMNTCYSFVDAKNVIHVASVHQYDEATKTVQPVKGAGGVSAARNELEGKAPSAGRKHLGRHADLRLLRHSHKRPRNAAFFHVDRSPQELPLGRKNQSSVAMYSATAFLSSSVSLEATVCITALSLLRSRELNCFNWSSV
jgi:hypothetical protein